MQKILGFKEEDKSSIKRESLMCIIGLMTWFEIAVNNYLQKFKTTHQNNTGSNDLYWPSTRKEAFKERKA